MNYLHKKEILIMGGFILLFVMVLILYFHSQTQTTTNKLTILPTITPFQAQKPVQVIEKNPTLYVKILLTPQPFSNTDSLIKQRLIDSVNGESEGIITTQPTFKVLYLSSVTGFWIVISTPDIARGQNDSITWLKEQGFSQVGICHLPIIYDIDASVKEMLKGKTVTINDIPPGC